MNVIEDAKSVKPVERLLTELSATVHQVAVVLGALTSLIATRDTRPEHVTRANAPALYGKSFRALDAWAQGRGIARLKLGAKTPAYRTADLDAAIEATAAKPAHADAEATRDEYASAVAATRRKRGAR